MIDLCLDTNNIISSFITRMSTFPVCYMASLQLLILIVNLKTLLEPSQSHMIAYTTHMIELMGFSFHLNEYCGSCSFIAFVDVISS